MSLTAEQIDHVVELDNISPNLLKGLADDIFKHHGSNWVKSLVRSDFEGADYTCNLNRSLTTRTDASGVAMPKVDLILDNLTFGHVFNPGMSMWNAGVLLSDDGYLKAVLPVYGFCDHGLTKSHFRLSMHWIGRNYA